MRQKLLHLRHLLTILINKRLDLLKSIPTYKYVFIEIRTAADHLQKQKADHLQNQDPISKTKPISTTKVHKQ